MNQSIERKENWHEDFIAYLASQYRPKIYVELGLYQCELFNKIVPYADILIGVDISAEAGKRMTVSEKTIFVNATTDEFVEGLRSSPISIDMLFIDADHSKESVLKDFWNYFPFVKDHGLILLHDTHPKNLQYTEKGYCGDAYLVIEELKKHTDEFELMTIPIHPGLTLIRKRKTQLAWEKYLGFNFYSCIDDIQQLNEIKNACYSKLDVRAGWIGSGIPKTNNPEFQNLAKWATEHWSIYNSFISMIVPKQKTKILDIGCGMGHSTICLKNLLDVEIVGVDFDQAAISFAMNYNSDQNIKYVCEDFFDFHSTEKFDYIFALEILEHIPHQKHIHFIEKCFSLLSPDGKIFFTTPNALDEEDGEFGHIGLLNRGRAKVFLERIQYYIEQSSFIDNKKLLSGSNECIILKNVFEYEDHSQNLSHFRLVLSNNITNNGKLGAVVYGGESLAQKKYRIVCITQVYNELRKGNLERFWKFIEPVCDGLVVYDDGSTDGSYEYMLDKAIFTLRAGENDFKNEVNHKKILLEYALKLQPDFILWLDTDEVLTANAEVELQNLCKYADENNIDGLSFHEINLWRSHSWKRIDNSYDLGWFVRLWRVTPELAFKDSEPGLHQQQFPHSISKIERTDRVGVIHYGFASDRSLAFKYLVYRSHGQTGWALERLLDENTLTLEKVDAQLFSAGLFIDDDKPAQRSFGEALASLDDYKNEVFKPRISIVCLIYKSTDWLKFVYEQVLKYTDLSDKEFYFVANDANEEVLRYLDQNYIPHYVWNNSPEQREEWYINNVYRAWNYAAEKAKGDYLLFINSDMAFSENWVENLFGKLNGSNCVASRLVESGKLLSGDHAVSKNFGRTVNDYDEAAFHEYVKTISADELVNGGLFMPLLIRKDDFMKAGGYPEGNVVPGTENFNPAIAKKGEACVSGDVVLMQKLESIGVQHTTTYDSVVYHFQCGEMDSAGTVDLKKDDVRTIISNDYLLGRMGEKTMWGFLLSNLPNAVGVDMDSLHVTKNFEMEARKHIKENYPESAVVVQNATFIDLIDNDHFTILYLQDNLRAMGRKSYQQEVNIKHADLLVTNSKITAASYPEYDFEIIPIGVDDELFRPLDKLIVRSAFNIPNSKVGIFVGDLSEVKGWEKVKKVIDNHDEIFWIIVSKDNKQYEKKNCRTFNRIDQAKLAKLLNCADFFILGSPVETQCLAAIEACFCNLPVIMHNTGIFADFSEDERALIGYFGSDFEKGLSEVLEKKYSPRQMMFEKKLTIGGMARKWKDLISRARFFAEQKKLKPAIERPPLFSVIVPVYNHDKYLGEALDTLLAQTFTNWEAIIVNDGSTDSTGEVIAKYLSLDKRFKAIHKENGGVSSALNAGIKNAKGDWICWLSSDDWFEPNKLEIHYKAIAQFPQIKFFTSHWYIYLQQTGQKIKTGLWLETPEREFQVTRFFWANYVHGNSIAIHKSVFDTVGLFDENLRQGQDFDMWLRISAQYESIFIDHRTCTTRIHPGQTTNSFVEGGVLDSTRALYKFLNQNSFERLFPLLDLTIDQHILLAINEVIYITTKDNAFLYKCGFTSALIEKTLSWVEKRRAPLRSAIMKKIEEIIDFYIKEQMHPDAKALLKKFLSKKTHTDGGYDLVKDGMAHVEKLIKEGDQKRAGALEIYFDKILKTNAGDLKNYSTFVPRLIGFPENEVYKQLEPKEIISWDIKPNKANASSVLHKMKFKCSTCGEHARISFISKMEEANVESKFLCPSCKTGYKYDDIDLDKDLIEFNKLTVQPQETTPTNRVAFFIANASVIGGGTKVLFKHIEWLNNLRIEVVVYSYTAKPNWAQVDVKYVQLKDGQQIESSGYDLFVMFSIFDLPLMLNHVPMEKIVHICQGYEGYHYGVTYEEARNDKHILTKLHSIPVRNIVVSKHLLELFNEKFDREAEYIPNGVDHKIFYPDFNNVEREKAILFIGNPKHNLKGFHFLSHAIHAFQNTQLKIGGLKLYLVIGFELEEHEEIKENLEKELNCEIIFKIKQSSEEVARLMRNVSLVVCTSWYEGFSLPLLEAMACGTPAITTKNMGAESFCFDSDNSFLVDYGDVTKLSKRIAEIFYKKIPLGDILENGLTTSIEYSEYNSAHHFIDAYQKLLSTEFDSGDVKKFFDKYRNFTRTDFGIPANNIPANNFRSSLNDYIENAKFYLNGNNLERALDSIEKAIEVCESEETEIEIAPLLNLAGRLSFTLNDFQKAKKYFELELNISPGSSSACLGLGDVLFAEEQHDNAKTMYEWALKINPQNNEALQKLSNLNELLGYEINHTSLVE